MSRHLGRQSGRGVRAVAAILALLAGIGYHALVAPSALAATLTVDSTVDAPDASPGDGVCATAAGECTLRAAIQEANALPGADTVTVPAGTFTLSIPGAGEKDAATGDLDLYDVLTIIGAGAGSTVIDGGGLDRVFDVAASATVDISNLTITNGAADKGGGIKSLGDVLDLSNVSLTANATTGPGAGAFFSGGTATLVNVVISGNSSAENGGGLAVDSAVITLTDGTVSGNSAIGKGGGIQIGVSALLNLYRSTVDGNVSIDKGGGINVEGAAVVINVTISGNTSAVKGGGLHQGTGTLTIDNTTITGNIGPLADGIFSSGATTLSSTIVASNGTINCLGAITSNGYNLDSASSCGLVGTGDLQNTDPLLGSLQDNGGPTQTHALSFVSPALDAGPPTCPPPATDQRGIVRPQDGDGVDGAQCDIGAFEFVLNQPPVLDPVGDQSGDELVLMTFSATASDSDTGDELSFSLFGSVPGGASIHPVSGVFTWTPSEAQGPGDYSFDVVVTDDSSPNLSDSETISVTVNETNQAPVAVADTLEIDEDTPGEVFVLANDSDQDGDQLTVTGVTQPPVGTVQITPDGSVLYLPPVDFAGATAFTYTVGDGHDGFAVGVVSVVVLAVNDAPVGFADSVILTSYRSQAIHVLANDWDPDGDELHIESVSSSEHGRVEINSDGSVTFTPDIGWVGTDTFTYIVADPEGAWDEVTVVVELPVATLQGARRLAQQLGVGALPFESPEPESPRGEPLVTLADSVTLLAAVFYQTLLALQLPLSTLALALALVMMVALVTTPGVPLILTGSRRRYRSVVRLDRESILPVYAEPAGSEVIYNYDRVAQGIVSTGSTLQKAGARWRSVETPNGEGWVDDEYLSEQIDLQSFQADQRPVRLVIKLADRLRGRRSITSLRADRCVFSITSSFPTAVSSSIRRSLMARFEAASRKESQARFSRRLSTERRASC